MTTILGDTPKYINQGLLIQGVANPMRNHSQFYQFLWVGIPTIPKKEVYGFGFSTLPPNRNPGEALDLIIRPALVLCPKLL